MGSAAISCLAAFAGGADGGGGDTQSLVATAWYAAVRPIYYCIEVDRDFGIGAAEADRAFRDAVKTWDVYLNNFLGYRDHINTNYQAAPRCGGWEDLTIYLGVANPKVEAAAKHYQAPIAFAERLSYDHTTNWGKGFIWVKKGKESLGTFDRVPDWAAPHRLKAMLLHELGHVLGCPHIEGTVMDTEFANLLMNADDDLRAQRLARIDGRVQLLPNFRGVNTYEGQLGPDDKRAAENTFQRIFGRKPVGEVKAKLEVGVNERTGFPVTLTATDGKGTESVVFQFPDSEILFNIGPRVFVQEGDFGHRSEAIYGRMALAHYTKGSQNYTISYEFNSSRAFPVRLRYYWNGVDLTLFRVNP